MAILPVTPHPFPEESIFSWIVRVAAANQIPSPWHIYRLLGFNQGQMKTPTLDTSKLWPLISEDRQVLHAHRYADISDGGTTYVFRDHPILARDLALKSPKVCPDCLSENGYASAHWDLELVTICHVHKRKLVYSCPHCGKSISWFRGALDTCSCGTSYAVAPVDKASQAECRVIQAIYEISYNNDCQLKSPVFESIVCMPLRYFLNLVGALGKLSLHGELVANNKKRGSPESIVFHSANILDNWPSNFHALLSRLASRPRKDGSSHTSVIAALSDVCDSITGRAKFRPHGEFVLAEFRRFLAHTWTGFLDPRITQNLIDEGMTPRWINFRIAARMLGVDPRTLESFIEKGLIQSRKSIVNADDTDRTDLSYRICVRSDDLKSEWFVPTDLLSEREAGRRLGLPISVLRELRSSGDYRQTYFGQNAIRYAVRDINDLKYRLVNARHYCPADSYNMEPLGKVMNFKLHGADLKAELVRRIIRGEIRTVKSTGQPTLASLQLHPADLATAIEKLYRPNTGSLTIRKTAKILKVTNTVVAELVALGYLTKLPNDAVCAESIREFQERYTCLNSLFFSQRKKIALVEREFLADGAELIVTTGRKVGTTKSFIRKEDIPRVRELATTRATHSTRWNSGTSLKL